MSKETDQERWELLEQIDEITTVPVIVLSFVWVIVVLVEFIWGASPYLLTIGYLIWGIFILDFVVSLIIAPNKLVYIKNNWFTLLSLLLPALRFLAVLRALRVLRFAGAARALNLAKLITSLNRGMRAARTTLGRRKAGFVFVLTTLVLLVGAAGMQAFESPQALAAAGIEGKDGLVSYGDALWWTAMILTTIGSEYWPQTPEGRILGFIISLYALGVLGYVTAVLASFFIGSDASATDRYE
ncbi:MAG: ion transporter [Chloroflexi bacterium]|jgi:voltage-gated potassium channel|nr:ion transporter [Chloroflexota bacterium]